jgi:hypothetical protein
MPLNGCGPRPKWGRGTVPDYQQHHDNADIDDLRIL